MRRPARFVLGALLLVLVALLLVQAVPYGRDHTNPPVGRQARWGNAEAEHLFASACGDCHSNRTRWPWYTNVAPASWLVQRDVMEGRRELNLSEWDGAQPALGEVADQIAGGEMPPWQYTLIRSRARLTPAQRRALIAGLRALYAADPPAATRSGR